MRKRIRENVEQNINKEKDFINKDEINKEGIYP